MTDQEILEAIQPLTRDGMLPCPDALATAAKLAVTAGRIGKVCNEHEIRIINCQLGCFGIKRSQPK